MPSHNLPAHFVWHDLFTPNVENAQSFYKELLDCTYLLEHATDFVWTGGDVDYPLIMMFQHAHGGMVQTHGSQPPQWLAFVEVEDVDRTTRRAQAMGANILRAPLDVPGVGYCSVLVDPNGALISPFKKSHANPPPKNLFVWDQLLSRDVAASSVFYCVLFNWGITAGSTETLGPHTIFHEEDGTPFAGISKLMPDAHSADQWVPYFAVDDLEQAYIRAKTLGAKSVMARSNMEPIGSFFIFRDPFGALFGLTARTSDRIESSVQS